MTGDAPTTRRQVCRWADSYQPCPSLTTTRRRSTSRRHGSGSLCLDRAWGRWSQPSRCGRAPPSTRSPLRRRLSVDRHRPAKRWSILGPLEPSDPWGAYAKDELALLDHLGHFDRFHVMGACIGGSFASSLIEQAPTRVAAAVLDNGWDHGGNRPLCTRDVALLGCSAGYLGGQTSAKMRSRNFGRNECGETPSSSACHVTSFRIGSTPLLVLGHRRGTHPTVTGREIAAVAAPVESSAPRNDPRNGSSRPLRPSQSSS